MAGGTREASSVLPVRVRVLGRVTIEGPSGAVEVRGRQASAVVAFLALERRPTTQGELAELLWGLNPSSHWRGALRGVLSKVRAAWTEAGMPGHEIRSTDTVIQLGVSSIATDLDDIEGLLKSSSHHAPTELAAAADALEQPFLSHDESEWGTRVRQRIDAVSRRVAHLHARVLADNGFDEAAAAVLERAIANDSLDETAYHLLIESRLRLGQRAAAGSVFETLATHLADEFGISPSPATAALLLSSSADQNAESTRSHGRQRHDHQGRAARRRPIHPHSADPFVGRHSELDELGTIWRRVIDEQQSQLVIVQGPPGMGKTRLVDEFCTGGHVDPPIGRVVWGRNRGNIDRAYGALAEAIEHLLTDEPELLDRLGDQITGLLPLLPHLATHPHQPPRDDESTRTHLIHGLRALVIELMDEPTVWFVDDLQWASPDALGVVEAVLDGVVGPLLVVVTSRHPPSEIAAGLASLQRVVTTRSIHLEGLSVDDVAGLFDNADVARTVQERTAGLPFYASEIARLSRLSGEPVDLDTVPATIADWVTRRVRALDRAHSQTLQLASVIGNEFDVDVLLRCSSDDELAVVAITDELVTGGLLTYSLEPSPAGTRPTHVSTGSTLQFSHMITRDIVYENIGLGTRAHLHRHVARVMEAHSTGINDVAALAYHYARAGRETWPVASEYSLLAGHQALTAGAWVNAEGHFTRTADLSSTAHQRSAGLVGRGRALLGQGRFADARAVLLEAIDIATAERLPLVQAMATLALVGRAGRGASASADDADHVRRLRLALAALGTSAEDDESVASDAEPVGAVEGSHRGAASRPELLSSLERELALSLLLTDAREERSALLHRSLQRARSIRPSSPVTLANALLGSRYAQLEPDQLDSRLADIDEVLAMPPRDVGDEVLLAAYCYRHEDLLRRGDPAAAEEALRRAEQIAAGFPHPYWRWAIRTWRALSWVDAGDLDRAEHGAFDANAMRHGVEAAQACLTVNLVDIRLYQGRIDEMMPVVGAAVEHNPTIPAYRAVLALCAAESRDDVLASRMLRSFADRSFTNLPGDTNRFLGLAVLAHVAASVGDRDAGRVLTELLEPFRYQWVVLQCYGGGGATWGPTAHALARLAALDGRIDDAIELFDDARRRAAHSPLVRARIDANRAAIIS